MMNVRRRLAALGAIFCIALGSDAAAATIAFNFDNINQAIPDGSALGLSDSRVITTPETSILNVTVSLTISGNFNGDLYAQLTHGSGFSVLLNRVGRTALNEFGYDDSGLGITLSDSAPAGDVHVYRTTLFGNDNTPLTGPLTGSWAPDGRTTDPDLVLNTDPRSAFLSSFNGLNPNGTWTLFIADTSAGGQSTLQSWAVNMDAVPEPDAVQLLVAGCCLLWVVQRKRRASRVLLARG